MGDKKPNPLSRITQNLISFSTQHQLADKREVLFDIH